MRYGQELLLDLHNCEAATFTRDSIVAYFAKLCDLIGMKACDLHFWDDLDVAEDERQADPRTKGTIAVQFILTSNITIHTLDELGAVYVNLFSCEPFDANAAADFTMCWFHGQIVQRTEVDRL